MAEVSAGRPSLSIMILLDTNPIRTRDSEVPCCTRRHILPSAPVNYCPPCVEGRMLHSNRPQVSIAALSLDQAKSPVQEYLRSSMCTAKSRLHRKAIHLDDCESLYRKKQWVRTCQRSKYTGNVSMILMAYNVQKQIGQAQNRDTNP